MQTNKLFRSISVEKLDKNPFKLIGKDWFLITAGQPNKFNTMTGGWGHFGVLWNKPTIIIFVRPTRYTYHFTEKYEYFSISFFDKKYKKVLNYCGKFSGADVDKIKETNITPVFHSSGTVYFDEANLVFICKKIYQDTVKPEHFLLASLDKHYPLKDYHQIYIGEIIDCFIKI